MSIMGGSSISNAIQGFSKHCMKQQMDHPLIMATNTTPRGSTVAGKDPALLPETGASRACIGGAEAASSAAAQQSVDSANGEGGEVSAGHWPVIHFEQDTAMSSQSVDWPPVAESAEEMASHTHKVRLLLICGYVTLCWLFSDAVQGKHARLMYACNIPRSLLPGSLLSLYWAPCSLSYWTNLTSRLYALCVGCVRVVLASCTEMLHGMPQFASVVSLQYSGHPPISHFLPCRQTATAAWLVLISWVARLGCCWSTVTGAACRRPSTEAGCALSGQHCR